MRKLLERMGEWCGGPIPVITNCERDVHAVDGVTHQATLVWLNRGLTFSYHTPRHPRDVRRARAEESRHLDEMVGVLNYVNRFKAT